MRTRSIAGAFLLAATAAAAAIADPAAPSREISPENAEAAVTALRASAEVERDVLKTQVDLYKKSASERDGASKRLGELLGEYDALLQGDVPAPADQIAAKEKEIADAERLRGAALERGREIRGRIVEIQERIAGLDRKIASLREALPKPRETLTGVWQVTYLPGTNRGVFTLRQTGTIVAGQYQLDGGWKGSLQGTFIDGKIFLQRIDSKLGRSSELQGFLSPDGQSLRGTWLNYNLTDGAASSGSWTATRQVD